MISKTGVEIIPGPAPPSSLPLRPTDAGWTGPKTATQRRRRTHVWLIGGGCLTWLVLIWVFLLAVAVGVDVVLVAIGALLSLAGWIDQRRFEPHGSEVS